MATDITAWKARRSGGRITIYGKAARLPGDLRVPNVDTIERVGPDVIATDKEGRTYRLM